MKYYAMETEDGATLYFDGHGGAIVDIDIPDGVETIPFLLKMNSVDSINVCISNQY